MVHCIANDAYNFFVSSIFPFIKIAGKAIKPSMIRTIFKYVSYPSTSESPIEVYAAITCTTIEVYAAITCTTIEVYAAITCTTMISNDSCDSYNQTCFVYVI